MRILPWLVLIIMLGCKHSSNVPDPVIQEPKPTEVSTFVSLKDVFRAQSIAFDKIGNMYLADGIARIFKVTPDGKVSPYAGINGYGYEDGTLANAKFFHPYGLVFDSANNLYVADNGNQSIRKITPDGKVTTFAGKPYNPDTTKNICVDGVSTNARFVSPYGLAVDKSDNIYVVEFAQSTFYASVARKITPDAKVTTIAGIPGKIPLEVYEKPETFVFPSCVAVNKSGDVYVGSRSQVIYKISSSGRVELFSGKRGKFDITNMNNGPVQTAQYGVIQSLAFDVYDNLYVGESGAGIVRKITPDGQVTNVTGNRFGGYLDGPLETAQFTGITGQAFDKSGNLFIVDGGNFAIRKITFK